MTDHQRGMSGVVRITQLDGKLPNLALMRLAAWHHAQGDAVYWERGVTRRFIIQNHKGHEAHRHLDRITTELLLSLGYGEGIGIFCRAVQDWHHPQLSYPLPQRPRLFCRLGWHKWVSDRESDYPWVSPEICPHCGARRSSNPCP